MRDGADGKAVEIVALDYETVRVEVPRPSFAHRWVAYPQTAPGEIAARIRDAAVIITNKAPLAGRDLAAAKKLRLIAVAATGFDHIDLNYCRANGVGVCNARAYANRGVAEHVIALIFALSRGLGDYHRRVYAGEWGDCGEFSLRGLPIDDVCGKQIGLIGAGNLGRATARLADAVGMKAVFLGREGSGQKNDVPRLPMAELLATSDIISLHCPLSEDNRGMIGESELAKMKRSALLINTARGALVDSAALIAAIQSGAIGGAGVDVLDVEPPPAEHPLLRFSHPRLMVTPHIAWASRASLAALAAQLRDNIEKFFAGEPQNLVV